MKKMIFFRALTLVLFSLLVQACVAGTELATRPAAPGDLQGDYTLLLYGCHHPADIKDLAILVSNTAKYPVEIHDLPTSFKVHKDVPAQQAIKEAEAFVRCSHNRVTRTQVRRIQDEAGGTLGFEVRPIYFPLEFGQEDVLWVNYSLRDGVVRAYIRLDPDVERTLESSGSVFDRSR